MEIFDFTASEDSCATEVTSLSNSHVSITGSTSSQHDCDTDNHVNIPDNYTTLDSGHTDYTCGDSGNQALDQHDGDIDNPVYVQDSYTKVDSNPTDFNNCGDNGSPKENMVSGQHNGDIDNMHTTLESDHTNNCSGTGGL